MIQHCLIKIISQNAFLRVTQILFYWKYFMNSLAEMFEIKVNENKLTNVISNVITTQELHQKEIQSIFEKISKQNLQSNILEFVKPIIQSIQTKFITLINQTKANISQEIYDTDKKYKILCESIIQKNQSSHETIRQQVGNIKEQVQKQIQSFQTKIREKALDAISQNMERIKICEKAIISHQANQLNFFKEIIEPKEIQKHFKSNLLKEEPEIKQDQVYNFSEDLQNIKSVSNEFKKKFQEYLKNSNFQGSRQNSNLLYAVITDKLEKVQAELKLMKDQQRSIRQSGQIRSHLLIPPQNYSKPQTAQKTHKELKEKRWSYTISKFYEGKSNNQNENEDSKQEYPNIVANISELKNQLQQKILKQRQFMENSLQKIESEMIKLRKICNKLEQQMKYLKVHEKTSKNNSTDAIESGFMLSFKKLQIEIKEKVENFISKEYLRQWEETFNAKLKELTQLVSQKAKKKQTREAMIFMEEKIKDIITLLSVIQENSNIENKQGRIFNYISYDKQSLQNKEYSKQNTCRTMRPIKSSRILLKGKQRQIRRSNGIF